MWMIFNQQDRDCLLMKIAKVSTIQLFNPLVEGRQGETNFVTFNIVVNGYRAARMDY